MTFRPELIDELLKEYQHGDWTSWGNPSVPRHQNPEDLMGEKGILKQLTKALVERCLTARSA